HHGRVYGVRADGAAGVDFYEGMDSATGEEVAVAASADLFCGVRGSVPVHLAGEERSAGAVDLCDGVCGSYDDPASILVPEKPSSRGSNGSSDLGARRLKLAYTSPLYG